MSIFSLLFLLNQIDSPFFNFFSYWSVSVARACAQSEHCPFNSTQLKFLTVFAWRAQKNFWVRGKFVRPAMLFPKCDYKSRYSVSWRAKSSLCWQQFSFLLCIRELNSSRDSQATEIRIVFRQFCAEIKLANNSLARALLRFLLFPLWC